MHGAPAGESVAHDPFPNTTREILLDMVKAYGPRSNGRRARDVRGWWVTFVLVLLQGGFFLAWKMQFSAQEQGLLEERRMRAEQHAALVQQMQAQTDALRQLAEEVRQNTEADKITRGILIDRGGRK